MLALSRSYLSAVQAEIWLPQLLSSHEVHALEDGIPLHWLESH